MTAARLRTMFYYDENTGLFTRLIAAGGKRSNTIAGWKHKEGYTGIRIDRTSYLAHRLAWLYAVGRWPFDQLDHINGDRSDNRLANLRECSNAENCQNVKAHCDGSGCIGTTFDKRHNRWVASIGHNGKRYHLGNFDDQDSAAKQYQKSKRLFHDFATR
jgi:hypothetical protein